jgi:glycosyltransferase involved in cell wall biosynthesis
MKKVLIITYYWPPGGGAGVQRWLKFVKYLRRYGWEPIVYTPQNPENPIEDNSLLKDLPENLTVLKTPIWEPYSAYKKFIGQKKEVKINSGFLTENKKPKVTEKIAVWLRGNFFIPDARVFWIKPSIKYLSGYLSENPVDAVISSGPPHSMHLIALGLKKRFGIKWLADFRDPWTNIDYYEDLLLSRRSDKEHKKLEHAVIAQADAVVTVGDTMKEEFKQILNADNAENGGKFFTITNGYDEDDIYKGPVTRDKKFTLAHIGTMVRTRNPEALWKVLAELVKEHATLAEDFELKLVGKIDISVLDSIEKYGLKKFLNKIDYLPHTETIKLQQQSQVLLLLINNSKNAKGILTGKFFEYMAAQRPIICIGPADGDAAKILAETNSGLISGYEDYEGLKKNILGFYLKYKQDTLVVHSEDTERYSRLALTERLAEVLNRM